MTTAQDAYEERRRLEAQRKLHRRRRDPLVQALHAAARHKKVAGAHCRIPGCHRLDLEGHHIVPRSHFGQRDHAVHDEDNLMPLCHDHHQAHHTTTQRVPRASLTLAEFAFASTHKSQSWIDRWYPR